MPSAESIPNAYMSQRHQSVDAIFGKDEEAYRSGVPGRRFKVCFSFRRWGDRYCRPIRCRTSAETGLHPKVKLAGQT